MTRYPDVFAALCAPFDEQQVKQLRKGQAVLRYVTARTIMNRLDEVLGPENWWDDYPTVTEHGVGCRLSIRLPDDTVLTKSDAGGAAGMSDAGDNEKSAFSDAFKRAAAKFGVGRYLYGDGVPRFADPRSARPVATPAPRPAAVLDGRPAPPRDLARLPVAGTPEAYTWFKDLGDHYGCSLVRRVQELADADNLPAQWKSWDQPTLTRIAVRAVRYCKQLANYDGELDALAAPVAEQAAADDLAATRSVMAMRAGMLWAHRYPRTTASDQDIRTVISEISDGAITDYATCEDRESMLKTSDIMRKLLPSPAPDGRNSA